MNSNHSRRRAHVARGGVLVLGGGFAGSYVARELGSSGATVVNPTSIMHYTAVPLRTICPHADLVVGSVVGLDADRRLVEVASDAGRISIAYAELVVALGSVTAPHPLLGELGLPLDRRGRVSVDVTLRVTGASNIWALGDCAAVPNEATPGEQARRLAGKLAGDARGELRLPGAHRLTQRYQLDGHGVR